MKMYFPDIPRQDDNLRSDMDPNMPEYLFKRP